MPPTVSINLCCYNSEKYLRETLDSIVGQTYKDWELVIINDGSKDSTESIICEYIRQGYPIIYHHQENKGLAHSRNEALKRSQGEYIAFIDHDDVWLPEKLQRQVNIFENQSDVDFVYTNYLKMITYNKNRIIVALKKKQPQGFIFKDFIFRYEVFVSTVIVSKRALDSLDTLFDGRLALMEEYDVFMRILYKHKAAYLNEVTAIYRFHDKMTTLRSPMLVLKEYPYLIENLKKIDLAFDELYPDIVNHMNIRWIKYNKAKINIMNGNNREARQYVAPHKWYSLKLFLLYLASFLPKELCVFLYHNTFFLRGRI